jgi:nicotinamidase/pyrazinamidase
VRLGDRFLRRLQRLRRAAAGFPAILIEEACRAIDSNGSLEAATRRMATARVERAAAAAILSR